MRWHPSAEYPTNNQRHCCHLWPALRAHPFVAAVLHGAFAVDPRFDELGLGQHLHEAVAREDVGRRSAGSAGGEGEEQEQERGQEQAQAQERGSAAEEGGPRARLRPAAVADAHGMRRRICSTPKKASLKMPMLILLLPLRRSRKVMGTSAMRKPSRFTRYFISIWKA